MNQASNSIILNATGAILNGTTSNSLYIGSIRDISNTLLSTTVISYPLYYNPTTKEINTRSSQNSFLFMSHSTIQPLTSGVYLTMLFSSTYGQSFGNTWLSYTNGIYQNISQSTILLNVNVSVGYTSNGAAGMRCAQIIHSSDGIIFRDSRQGLTTEITTNNMSTIIKLTSFQSFYIQAQQTSGANLNMSGSGYQSFLTINLLN